MESLTPEPTKVGTKQATKKAARLTQRCEATFDSQTAKQRNGMHLLEMAEQELAGNGAWQYYHRSIIMAGMEEENEQSCIATLLRAN